jgi:uncharacterized protein
MTRPIYLFGLLWAIAFTASAAPAITFELPPLVQPASDERHPGKVIWADLVTPDLAGAKRFYAGVFGWTFNDVHTGDTDYSIALHDGAPVAGVIQRNIRSGERRQPAWLSFFSVPDVHQAEVTIQAHGGKVLSRERTYAQRGTQAVFTDPEGAVFAVLQSSNGDPPDVLAEPGEWIWSSLVARNPDADAAFYQDVFGYEVFEMSRDDGFDHVLLASDDYARASINARPSDASGLPPHWINFVRVVSTTETVARIKALGGRVLVQPHPDRHGGLVAVVADPAGASFGLLEWTDADSKEVGK